MSRKTWITLLCLSSLVVACGGGSSTPRTPPPTGLAYPTNVLWLSVGADMGSLSPQVSGVVRNYSVSPALPAGLSLNTTSGVITGTPLMATKQATYQLMANNDGGSSTFALTLAVDLSPSGLNYASPAQRPRRMLHLYISELPAEDCIKPPKRGEKMVALDQLIRFISLAHFHLDFGMGRAR